MQSSFVIIREDLQVDPITIVADSLLIGRLPTCELLLNHPSVSRLQAGLSTIGDDYFIRNFRPGNPITLNGNPVDQYTALTGGDILGIGPFALNVDFLEEALALKVSLQIAASPDEALVRRESSTEFWEDLPTTSHLTLPGTPAHPRTPAHRKNQPRQPEPEASSSKALDVFWAKRITAATKAMKHSPLSPRLNRPAGKAQSVWKATTDLKSRRHALLILVMAGVVALIAGAAALFYTKAFAPGALSDSHNRSGFALSPPVATHANAGKCTSCHQWRNQMDAACTSCHTTEAFVATVIPAHMNAGIGCVDCHAEHRGNGFNAIAGALLSCFDCHNDNNQRTFNGKRVSTPHGGTFGYPVVDGEWKWRGLDPEELAQRQDSLKLQRKPRDTEKTWRNDQFHAVHTYRVRTLPGIPGNQSELSCSSCHTSLSPPDRLTPRATCAKCHNGQIDPRTGTQVIASDKPNCTSCHVQHMKDKRHWNPALLAEK